MDWLDPPFQFFHPHPGMPFDLPVVRYEVGLAMRPLEEPPYQKVLPTIRFHVPGPVGWGLQPYIDFSNRILMQRVLATYDDLIDRVRRQVPFSDLGQMERLSPKSSEALTLRLTRHGTGLATIYDVEVVGK